MGLKATFVFTCDKCGATETIESSGFSRAIPKGWQEVTLSAAPTAPSPPPKAEGNVPEKLNELFSVLARARPLNPPSYPISLYYGPECVDEVRKLLKPSK